MASLTLRKALRLKKQVEAQLRTPGIASAVSIDIDDPRAESAGELIAAEEAKCLAALERHIRLSSVLSDLRSRIEEANGRGVNSVMSRIGHVDRQIAALKPLADGKAADAGIVAARIARKKATAGAAQPQHHGYGHRSDDGATLAVGTLTQETIDGLKARLVALRKEKEALEDQRLALNNREDLAIEIGDDDLLFLSELEIV